MDARAYDWKDVANAQFDKAFTFALLILLFAIMVTPKVDIQRQKFNVQQMQAVELPPEEREKIKPPEDIAKPVIDIAISDQFSTNKEADVTELQQLLDKLDSNIFDPNIDKATNSGSENPFVFEEFEDPPEAINPTPPVYPPSLVKTRMQGVVWLEVDVYKDGTLSSIRVKKSLMGGKGGFDEAAIEAVKKWKFRPGRSGGKPVDTTVTIPVEFSVESN